MKLATFSVNGDDRFGIVGSSGLIDLSGRVDAPDLKTVLANGVEKVEKFSGLEADFGFDDVAYLPPIPNPAHAIGIGLNTKSHFMETFDAMKRKEGDYPKKPRVFMRSPYSFVGHGANLIRPKVSTWLDYEGEIGVIIGKTCRYVSEDDALSYIGGYTVCNDGSVRDWQAHSNQVSAGKNFAESGAAGPWLLTADEVPDVNALTLQTKLNGKVVQNLTMDDLIFDFAQLISYLSNIYPLQPGDIILTGSPEGIGAIKFMGLPKEERKEILKIGDRVEITVPQIGTLANTVAAG